MMEVALELGFEETAGPGGGAATEKHTNPRRRIAIFNIIVG